MFFFGCRGAPVLLAASSLLLPEHRALEGSEEESDSWSDGDHGNGAKPVDVTIIATADTHLGLFYVVGGVGWGWRG